ncbi:MAG: helix-turn-helix domain-containing protein [Clostridia bacterium]|nr:helix-turn-helix domain-containing protein [Clostridia bacterium]MBQ8720120.1 helix-turn-helix domain-containing protein [Clostridia bacterium]
MTENSVSYTPIFEGFFSKLCYSNMLGIMRSPSFAIRNYKQDNLVLIYTTRGTLFCEQGGKSFKCEAGEYLLLDKRITHSYGFDPGIPSEIYWMHINGALANDIAAQINSFSKLSFIGKDQRVLEILQKCISLQGEGDASLFELSTLIASVLHVILKEAYGEHRKIIYSPDEHAFREEIDRILSSSDLSGLTLDALCAEMRMSKYYFSHRFKEYYGTAPIKYIKRLKLEKAKHLLRYSELKISVIAKEYGFSSHTYFSSEFRKEYGKTPEEYRKEFCIDKNGGNR